MAGAQAAGRRSAPNLTSKITHGAPPHGEVHGKCTGKVHGKAHGKYTGKVHGKAHGKYTGKVHGRCTGKVHGKAHGKCTGKVHGKYGPTQTYGPTANADAGGSSRDAPVFRNTAGSGHRLRGWNRLPATSKPKA